MPAMLPWWQRGCGVAAHSGWWGATFDTIITVVAGVGSRVQLTVVQSGASSIKQHALCCAVVTRAVCGH
jgi:hypothetical protein